MNYVPVIALVPQRIADRLDEWAEDAAVVDATSPLGEKMARNGWTVHMILAGSALSLGVESGVPA